MKPDIGNPISPRASRHAETGTEDGCLFALVLVWALAVIIVPLLAA